MSMATEYTVSTSRRQAVEDILEPRTQAREKGIEKNISSLVDWVINMEIQFT